MNKLKEYKLNELYRMSSGISSSKAQAGNGYPFVSFRDIFNNTILPENLTELMNTSDQERIKYSVKKGDVFITRTSETPDELAMSSVALKDYPNATFSGFAKRLRPIDNKKVYDEYMAFYFRSKYFRKIINANTIMTLRASFNEEIFSYIKIQLPDYDTQVKIGDMLYKIENKIQINNQINNNLEELMKTIYQRWFIEFEFPNDDGKPYKSSGGRLVYNEELKQKIPENWNVGNCYNNNLYEIIKPGIQRFETKNYLATGNVDRSNIADGEWIQYDNRESRANMQPLPNSIWFAKMKNSIKHITLPDNSDWFNKKYILSTGFLGIKCKENTLSYLHCFINSDYFEKIKDMLAHGATQEAINNEDLRAIKLLIPDKQILKSFENYTKAIIHKELDTIRENQRLNSLKEFLLPMLMNGQINVDDIEI